MELNIYTLKVIIIITYFQEDVLNYLPHPDCNPINFGSFEIHCIAIHDEGHFRLRELQIVGRVDGVSLQMLFPNRIILR